MTSAFADDGTALCTGIDPNALRDILQQVLDLASEWTKEQRLTLCPKKTIAVIFSHKKITEPRPLTLDGEEIAYEKTVKYLGVWLDDKLNLGAHIRSKVDNCKKMLHVMRTYLSRYVQAPPPWLLKWGYKMMVIANLSYGYHVWAHRITEASKQKFRSLQRLALTMITKPFPERRRRGWK